MSSNKTKIKGCLYVAGEKINTEITVQSYEPNRYYAPLSQVSKSIKEVMKNRGIKTTDYSFRSQSFSGGTSVDVTEKETALESNRSVVRSIINSFKSGQFDGMTDSYNYSSNRPYFISTDGVVKVDIDARFLFLNERY